MNNMYFYLILFTFDVLAVSLRRVRVSQQKLQGVGSMFDGNDNSFKKRNICDAMIIMIKYYKERNLVQKNSRYFQS